MNQEQSAGSILERAVLAVPSVNGVLRDAAGVQLAKWGLDDLADDALLVISELVTNALTASPGGMLRFRMMRWPRMLAIEVRDSSPERVLRREPALLDESGRGLWMVEQIARHWGQRWEADGTKTVYALLDLPS